LAKALEGINANEQQYRYESFHGCFVKKHHGGDAQTYISVASLPNGLYAFRVLDTKGVWHFGKFIVQH